MRAWVELSSYNNINAGNDPNNTSYDCRSQDGYHLDAVLGFDEILEMISKKEKLPPMKVGYIFHVWPVYILKDVFKMWNVFYVGCRPTIFH